MLVRNRCLWPLALLAIALLGAAASAKAKPILRGCPTGSANNTYGQQTLPLPYDGYMPAIDNETMYLHSVRHAGAAVNNLNAALARYPALRDEVSLSQLVSKVGKKKFNSKYGITAADSTLFRNNAGSVWNHALFWRIMTTYNTSRAEDHLSPELATLINDTWGSPSAMLTALRTSGGALFGSGWAWLVYRKPASSGAKPTLAIVTTPNQDNPLMEFYTPEASRGVPLIGVDVWEHAYYLMYRNLRASYLSNWVFLVDWAMLQRNYNLAVQGDIDSLYC